MANDSTMPSIYGDCAPYLPQIMDRIATMLQERSQQAKKSTGLRLYEHLQLRVKTDESMRDKCRRRNLPETPQSALGVLTDAIGLRVVVRFIDDIFLVRDVLAAEPDIRIIKEKDYIHQAKPNGYRGYHLILELTEPFPDVNGQNPGTYFAEIQLRTIAQDMWASLEHEMKYKQDIPHASMIASELKRCADNLASCDVQMQTIRTLISEAKEQM